MAMQSPTLKNSQVDDYVRDGFLIVRRLFTVQEIGLLGETARHDNALDKASSTMDDGDGNHVRLALWNDPGEGVYGMFARCRRLVDSVESLLGGEVYHYHSKMILKDARVGGAWAWHQDYGYWYQNGVLFPDLCSAMIAVDKATRQNGCLQVLRGSHKMGRVDHVLAGEQAGADPERVLEAEKRLDLVHVELDPGDVLFFHANLLHSSAANKTEQARWAMICCYNAASNNPYRDSHHPRYNKLLKVEDSKVLEVAQGDARRARVEFVNLTAEDASAKSLDQ
jgi:ectoine hydroxylase